MILKDEDCIHNEYYAYNRLFFRIIGLWQFQTSSKQLIYFCFINFMIVITLVEQISMLFKSELKLNSITKLLEIALPSLCFGFSYYNLLWNGAKMKKILYRIKCDWEELADKPELIILKKYANVSRLYTITIAINFYLYILFIIFPSLLNLFLIFFGGNSEIKFTLPIQIDYFIKNKIDYFLILSREYIYMCIVCMLGIANYSMYIAITQHACALLNIVSWRIDEKIKKIQQNYDHTFVNRELEEEREWIIGIIQYYTNAINFVDLIKLCYESVYLFEVFFASIIIMIDYFYLYQILSFILSISEELMKLSYIIGSLLVIFAYYYFGQKLIDKHTDVCTKLCEIPFYSLSLKTQKLLLFLIMRSMKPCNLSIKGVIVISHDLFATLMRTSFSYATVFYNLQ